MTYKPPPCESCGKRGHAVKCYRLDPKTWGERFRLLCPPCRAKLRYTAVTFRPYVERVPR